MKLSVILRCFVIALSIHVLILIGLGLIQVGQIVVKDFKEFSMSVGETPAPISEKEPDIRAIIGNVDYDPPKVKGNNTEKQANNVISKFSEAREEITGVAKDDFLNVIGVVGGTDSPSRQVGTGTFGLSNFGQIGKMGGFIDGTSLIGTTGGIGRGPWNDRFGDRKVINAKKYKQTMEAEEAIIAGLRWLKANQNSEGSWGTDSNASKKESFTSLAILAFLGHGHTQDDKEFGETISRGIIYLINQIDSNGLVLSKSMYSQGVVTLCLSEVYGMTGINLAKECVNKLIDANSKIQNIQKNDNDMGGWRYTATAKDSDLSVSGWMIMGMKSAKLAGLNVSSNLFVKAEQYIWNCYDENGGFGYMSKQKRTPNMTGAAVLCQQFMGNGRDNRIKKSLDYLKTIKFDYDTASGFAMYGWYYITQAMFQGSDEYWSYWNQQFQKNLVKAQQSDGRWDPPRGEAQFGPVYATSLSCLMLEVFYRYSPMYNQMDTNRKIK